jgi:hypothetical protein
METRQEAEYSNIESICTGGKIFVLAGARPTSINTAYHYNCKKAIFTF